MKKVSRNFRLDESLDSAVIALMEPDENITTLYNRVITAGLNVLTSDKEKPDDIGNTPYNEALIAALQAHIETLESQLERTNSQLETAQMITARQQELHLLDAKKNDETQPEYEFNHNGDTDNAEQQQAEQKEGFVETTIDLQEQNQKQQTTAKAPGFFEALGLWVNRTPIRKGD